MQLWSWAQFLLLSPELCLPLLQKKSLNKTKDIDISRLLSYQLFLKLILDLIHLPISNQSSIEYRLSILVYNDTAMG